MKKKTTLILGIISIATAASVYAKPARVAGDDVNFAAVNPLMQAIAAVTAQGDDQIEFAYPQFDPKLSSVANERLYYTVDGQIKNTPWHGASFENGSLHVEEATVHATADFRVERDSPTPGIRVKATSTIATPVMAFVQYGAKVAFDKASQNGPMDLRVAALLERARKVSTLGELAMIYEESRKVAIDIVRTHLKNSYVYLQCLSRMECGSPIVDQWGNRTPQWGELASARLEISDWTRILSSYEATTISTDGTTVIVDAPYAAGFLARATQLTREFKVVEPKYATLRFSNEKIEFASETYHQVTIEDLDKSHREIVGNLNGVIAGDSQSKEDMQRNFREALVKFKRVMNGQNQY